MNFSPARVRANRSPANAWAGCQHNPPPNAQDSDVEIDSP
jgi:hypothetical protein